MALSSANRPVVGATRARQGRLGRHVLWVLLVALVLVVLGFFAAWTWHSDELASTEVHNGKTPAAAQAFNAPPSDASVRQNYANGGPLAPQDHANPGQR